VLATPPRAFFPDVSLDLATPVWRLAYGVFDKIIFGFISLFTDCLPRSSRCLHHMCASCAHESMALYCARGFKYDYIDTGNPDHDIDHGILSHCYLDQGSSTHRSRLPR
jgi:hypothetical protein